MKILACLRQILAGLRGFSLVWMLPLHHSTLACSGFSLTDTVSVVFQQVFFTGAAIVAGLKTFIGGNRGSLWPSLHYLSAILFLVSQLKKPHKV
jgi:hypothetical protein